MCQSFTKKKKNSSVFLNVCIPVFLSCVYGDGSCFLSPADGPLWLPLEVCGPVASQSAGGELRGAACTYTNMFLCVCVFGVKRTGGVGSQNKRIGGLQQGP